MIINQVSKYLTDSNCCKEISLMLSMITLCWFHDINGSISFDQIIFI